MFKQIFLIASGFAIGQGSMFLVQTYLVIIDKFEIVADIGIALGILSLMQWVADGGGVFLLPKLQKENGFDKKITHFYLARFILAILVFLVSNLLLEFIDVRQTVETIFYFSPLVIFIWSFNLTGILDKQGKNKIAGPASGLNWMLSSIVALFFYNSNYLGVYLGIAFSVGLFLTVLVQYRVLNKWILNTKSISFRELANCSKLILNFNFAYIAAQSFGRIIPILIDSALGSTMAGTYLYAKNISNMAAQLVQFTKRAEFSKVIEAVNNHSFNLIKLISMQKVSLLVIFFMLIINAILYAFAYYIHLTKYFNIIELSLILSAILCLWVVASAIGQIYIALGKMTSYGMVMLLTSAIALLGIYNYIDDYGIYTVIYFEIARFLVQIIVYISILKYKIII